MSDGFGRTHRREAPDVDREVDALARLVRGLQAGVLAECDRLARVAASEAYGAASSQGPRFVPFVALFEVPLREGLRDLLRDAEARAGARPGTIAAGVVEEMRAWTSRDIPFPHDDMDGPGRTELARAVAHAVDRCHSAAEQILRRRLRMLAR